MPKNFICLLSVSAFIAGAAPLPAQEPAKAPVATLTIQDKNYPLSHAVAYETTIDDRDVIMVVLSGQAITAEKLNEGREKEKEGEQPDFKRPYLRLEFTKAGEFRGWSAATANASLSRHSGNATGELKVQDGRVIGQVNQPKDSEAMIPSAIDARFDVALLRAGESLPPTVVKKPGPAANIKPTVTGVFKGNGNEAKIAYVSAAWREPFGDQPSMVLIFTEKDHSKDKKPDFNAAFSKFGSALIISLHEDGGIFGCQVVHAAHEKKGFSSIGSIKTNNFTYADGKVEGELTTDGQVETFGETWEVNLKFVAPLGEIPPEFQPAEKKKPAAESKKSAKAADDDDDDELATALSALKPSAKSAAQPAGDQLNVKDMAMTKDASDVEYKTLVEHVLYKSKSNVKAVCAELTASLKAQGWATDGRDLVTPQSSILKRKRGDATLTIFVKPDAAGSEVKIFTSGLSWDEK